jgi:hypothetical protein
MVGLQWALAVPSYTHLVINAIEQPRFLPYAIVNGIGLTVFASVSWREHCRRRGTIRRNDEARAIVVMERVGVDESLIRDIVDSTAPAARDYGSGEDRVCCCRAGRIRRRERLDWVAVAAVVVAG